MQFRPVPAAELYFEGPTPATSSGNGARNDVAQVYGTWATLLDLPDDKLPLTTLIQRIASGGEVLRSFVQFLARVHEPHRSQIDLQNMFGAELMMIRRSFVAMRFACAAFMGGPQSPPMDAPVLAGVCAELLAGLKPRGPAHSMHICTVLQHLLNGHEEVVCHVLLRNHAPFMLLRALNRPGCGELLQALLLGCDVLLPSMMEHMPLRPLSTACMVEIRRYLEKSRWAHCLVTVLEHGVAQATGVSERRAHEQTQLQERTPSRGLPAVPSSPPKRLTQRQSPCCSPVRRGGAFQFSSPAPRTPGLSWVGTPQRLATPKVGSSPLATMTFPPSSPLVHDSPPLRATSPPLRVKEYQSPSPPVWPKRMPEQLFTSPDLRGCTSPDVTAACPSPLLERAGCEYADAGSVHVDEQCDSPTDPVSENDGLDKGVGLLLEYLGGQLDSCARCSDLLHRKSHEGDEDLAMRVTLQQQFLHSLFVDSALIQHVFRLLLCGAAEFESANLVLAILNQTSDPRRCLYGHRERLLEHFLPHVDTLSKLLTRGIIDGKSTERAVPHPPAGHGGAARGRPIRSAQLLLSKREVAPGPPGYTTKLQEPLGALRVLTLQILASIADMAPDATFLQMSGDLWKLLVDWFFIHRCNHIFQATCGRLICTALKFGGREEYEAVVLRTHLIPRLCETVLREGACGESWHDVTARRSFVVNSHVEERAEKLQVNVRRRRHPGGLGSIKLVMQTLCEVQENHSQNGLADIQEMHDNAVVSAVHPREPLAPRAGTQAIAPDSQEAAVSKIKAVRVEDAWSAYSEMTCLDGVIEATERSAQASRRRLEARRCVAKALSDAPIWAMALTAAGVAPMAEG